MKNFMQFVFFLIEKRRTILISLLLSIIISSIVVSIIPVSYTASVSIIPPQGSKQSLLSSLTSLSNITSSFESFSSASVDFYSDVLRSNAVIDSIIVVNDLQNKWKIKAIEFARIRIKKQTRQNISASEMLTLSFTDTSPAFAAKICGDYIKYLKQTMNKVNIEKQEDQLRIFDFLYNEQVKSIDKLSKELESWQRRNKSMGLEFSNVQKNPALSSLYMNLIDEKLKYYMLSENSNDKSVLENQKKKLDKLNRSVDSVTFSLSEKPEEVVEYMKLKTDIEVALMVKNEMMNKINLIKSNFITGSSGVFLLDSPQEPEIKSFPPRKEIVITVFLLVLLLDIIILAFVYYLKQNFTLDEIQTASLNFKKIYHDPFQRKN